MFVAHTCDLNDVFETMGLRYTLNELYDRYQIPFCMACSVPTIFTKKISTQLLTVLTMSVILHIEQRRGEEIKAGMKKTDTAFIAMSCFI